MQGNWLIYGATGYTGRLLAETAKARGLTPILGGRNRDKLEAVAKPLGLESRVFGLDDTAAAAKALEDVDVVLHAAGPFIVTSAPMIEACLRSKTHYLDITGEIDVLENAYQQSARAREAGIVICSGVGFDVVPTDCLAAALKEALPDAQRLILAFDAEGGLSPGTAKTSLDGFINGGRVRENGRIIKVPLAHRQLRVDFGPRTRTAVTIPWGDVATAFHTTGIPDVETYTTMPPKNIAWIGRLRALAPVLGIGPIRRRLEDWIDANIKGPDQRVLAEAKTYLWGEVVNAAGDRREGRLTTANGYALTRDSGLAMVQHLLENEVEPRSYTPSQLMGKDYVTTLPGSSGFDIK